MSERLAHRRPFVAAIACALAAAFLATGAFAQYSARWRVQLGDEARSDGALIFNVERQGGATLQVFVDVTKGSPLEVIAAAVGQGFREQLPPEEFEVEVNDRVELRKKGDAAEFELTLLRSTVTGLRVRISER